MLHDSYCPPLCHLEHCIHALYECGIEYETEEARDDDEDGKCEEETRLWMITGAYAVEDDTSDQHE